MANSLKITSQEAANLQQIVAELCQRARAKGPCEVEVSASINRGYSVDVRLSDVDKLEYTHDTILSIVVYDGQQKGSASSTDLSARALSETLEKAWRIARFTGKDDCHGLPERDCLAFGYPDCDLYHPWNVSPSQAIELAKHAEEVGMSFDPQISNSEGVSVETTCYYHVLTNSQGFMGNYFTTQHHISCAFLANSPEGMERDYDYTVARDPRELLTPDQIAIEAARRTVARLNPRRVKTGKYPVIYRANVAKGLLGHFISAIQGERIYHKSSFLADSLGQSVLSPAMTLMERPHLQKGIGSAPFDQEGVATIEQAIVKEGILETYCLSSYSARKLGMLPTGHAGGVHNMECLSHHTLAFDVLLAEMGCGLLITDVMGQGVNLLTGDYSRGASGFWIENGKIAYPVSELTIAGNLQEMLHHIVAMGSDRDRRSSVITGSLWVDGMTVAGE